MPQLELSFFWILVIVTATFLSTILLGLFNNLYISSVFALYDVIFRNFISFYNHLNFFLLLFSGVFNIVFVFIDLIFTFNISSVLLQNGYSGFQNPATYYSLTLIFTHNNVMCVMLGVFILVTYILCFAVFNNIQGVVPFTYEATTSYSRVFDSMFECNEVCTLTEITWTICPALILFLVGYPCMGSLYISELIFETESDFFVSVHASQWNWGYEYEFSVDWDSAFLVYNSEMLPLDTLDLSENPHMLGFPSAGVNSGFGTTPNDLFSNAVLHWSSLNYPGDSISYMYVDNPVVLPSGSSVSFFFTSCDVMHSWSLPPFGINMDAGFGRYNQAVVFPIFNNRFQSNEIIVDGNIFQNWFWGQCSEFCGTGHGFMPIMIDSSSLRELVFTADDNLFSQMKSSSAFEFSNFFFDASGIWGNFDISVNHIIDLIKQDYIFTRIINNSNSVNVSAPVITGSGCTVAPDGTPLCSVNIPTSSEWFQSFWFLGHEELQKYLSSEAGHLNNSILSSTLEDELDLVCHLDNPHELGVLDSAAQVMENPLKQDISSVAKLQEYFSRECLSYFVKQDGLIAIEQRYLPNPAFSLEENYNSSFNEYIECLEFVASLETFFSEYPDLNAQFSFSPDTEKSSSSDFLNNTDLNSEGGSVNPLLETPIKQNIRSVPGLSEYFRQECLSYFVSQDGLIAIEQRYLLNPAFSLEENYNSSFNEYIECLEFVASLETFFSEHPDLETQFSFSRDTEKSSSTGFTDNTGSNLADTSIVNDTKSYEKNIHLKAEELINRISLECVPVSFDDFEDCLNSPHLIETEEGRYEYSNSVDAFNWANSYNSCLELVAELQEFFENHSPVDFRPLSSKGSDNH